MEKELTLPDADLAEVTADTELNTELNTESKPEPQPEKTAGSGKKRCRLAGRHIFYIVFASVTVLLLLAAVFIPVLNIDSAAMEPTLDKGDIVLSFGFSDYQIGDVLAVKFGNKTLVKRVIAVGGQTVKIDRKGNVFVDGVQIDEPYIKNKCMGECTVKFPLEVPQGSYFCLDDNRYVALDSRSSTIGCIKQEQIMGKVFWCIWPLTSAGAVE